MKSKDEFLKSIQKLEDPSLPTGITITCHIAIRNEQDWHYVQETLENCRQYGSAEITGRQTLKDG